MSRPSLSMVKNEAPSTTEVDRKKYVRHAVQKYFDAQRNLRKGICLLNAGEYDQAVHLLTLAANANPESEDVATYLLNAHLRSGNVQQAETDASKRVDQNPDNIKETVRLALLKWKLGKTKQAIAILRDAVSRWPESAEIHFQLGTLLAAIDHTEEAEMRFTQAVAINNEHVDALVAMAMCMGAREEPREAVRHLKRAQNIRSYDTRIALLLSIAARAARDNGTPIALRAQMATQPTSDEESIAELARVIANEPEFAEAVLSIDERETEPSVFATLALTLQKAITLNPSQADLHFHCGCVLQRLGRTDEAIQAAERAVDIGSALRQSDDPAGQALSANQPTRRCRHATGANRASRRRIRRHVLPAWQSVPRYRSVAARTMGV